MESAEREGAPSGGGIAENPRVHVVPHPAPQLSSLDLTGASISRPSGREAEGLLGAPSIVLPNQDANYVCHFAIDIGGSLIKLVYFSPESGDGKAVGQSAAAGGRLHFVKFETTEIHQVLDFIESKQLHHSQPWHSQNGLQKQMATVKATGGGAYKYSEEFKNRLGVVLEREDEMGCLVAGANFLLKTIRDEAFTYFKGEKRFANMLRDEDIFPYLLVNIGSGVSMLKVDGSGDSHERVSGTNLGGGTFWGLCRLLTGTKGFDEMLQLSQKGDNAAVDMLVGDIYGGHDYANIGLSASTIASSFGKVVMDDSKGLADYRKEDIALALCRMVSYNIGQIAYLNAMRYGLKRVFFGGFFIRNHPYTMETISYAINYWSKGEMSAMFLRHEGFLGALGAFLKYDVRAAGEAHTPSSRYAQSLLNSMRTSSSHFVERFPMGAPYAGEMRGPPIRGLDEKVSWVERFVQVGQEPPRLPDRQEEEASTSGAGGGSDPALLGGGVRHGHGQLITSSAGLGAAGGGGLHVGVLHLCPSLETFPLLADPDRYEPDTIDISQKDEREYWITVLMDHIPSVVQHAVDSDGHTPDAKRRGEAFARAFSAHLERLRAEPGAYGRLGLAELLEMREECLREFHFLDAYRKVKESENAAALEVLHDLLAELDGMPPEDRLLALVEGVLAGNIFDWGSRACVQLYEDNTILQIYKDARSNLEARPWRVDQFDELKLRWQGGAHRRAVMLCDNSGADVVLGMLPLAREMLRRGTSVVLVANSLPAINDVTVGELREMLERARTKDGVLDAALHRAQTASMRARGGVPSADVEAEGSSDGSDGGARRVGSLYVVGSGHGSPCIDLRRVSFDLAGAAEGADLLVLEGMGRAIHTNYHAHFNCDVLKLAMLKNQRLAESLVQGKLYDCVCKFEPRA